MCCLWRVGSSLDLKRAHNPKVAGSNPAPATTEAVETKGAERFGPFGALRRTMKVFDGRARTPPVSRLILSSRNRPKRDARLAREWCWLKRRFIEVSQGSRNAVSDRGLRWRIGFHPRVGLDTQDSDEGLKVSPFLCGGSRRRSITPLTLNRSGPRFELWTATIFSSLHFTHRVVVLSCVIAANDLY
jgi:hypothetical protein